MESLPAARDAVFYGNLAEAALRSHVESGYVIYCIAKAMQRSPGANGLRREEVVSELHRLRIFGSAAHVRKLLRQRHGAFWWLGGDVVWLRCPGDVAWALGARRVNSHRHVVSTAVMRSRSARRAVLLAAMLPVGKPIRQHTIRRYTNVSERTQRRYRAAGHFRAERQDGDLTVAEDLPTPTHRRLAARQEREHGVYAVGAEARLTKRLPNVYFPAGTRIPRGRRSKKMFEAQPLSHVAEGSRTVPRVFFETVN